jgi:hypothetical protein
MCGTKLALAVGGRERNLMMLEYVRLHRITNRQSTAWTGGLFGFGLGGLGEGERDRQALCAAQHADYPFFLQPTNEISRN